MATQQSVLEIAKLLHDKKILNLDAPIRDVLSIDHSSLNSAEDSAPWHVIGGSTYVLVTDITEASDRVTNPTNI